MTDGIAKVHNYRIPDNEFNFVGKMHFLENMNFM